MAGQGSIGGISRLLRTALHPAGRVLEKVIITGSNGLLGQKLVAGFGGSWQILACDLHDASFTDVPSGRYVRLDVTDAGAVLDACRAFAPDVIVNTAAMTDVDGCESERERAYAINVSGVRNLVKFVLEHPATHLVQLSTDYVFDGKDGPYVEDHPEQPLGYYGLTKYIAEMEIRSQLPRYLIARTNVLYGTGRNVRPNFVTWMIGPLSEGRNIRIVTDQFNNPAWADNLADCLVECAERRIDGILNLGGGEYLSRYDMAVKTAEVFGFNRNLISPVLTAELGQAADRPLRGGLDQTRAKLLLDTEIVDFSTGLRKLKAQLEA